MEFGQFLWTLLQGTLEYVLPILFTQLAILLGALIVKVVNDIKAKLTVDQMEMIENIIDIAVNAAEQTNLKEATIDKKREALNIAQRYLTKNNIKIDIVTLDAMIEAAVFQNFNSDWS